MLQWTLRLLVRAHGDVLHFLGRCDGAPVEPPNARARGIVTVAVRDWLQPRSSGPLGPLDLLAPGATTRALPDAPAHALWEPYRRELLLPRQTLLIVHRALREGPTYVGFEVRTNRPWKVPADALGLAEVRVTLAMPCAVAPSPDAAPVTPASLAQDFETNAAPAV